MLATESRHPPGMVGMLTGELSRYADSSSDLEALRVPVKSGLTWFKGVLISDGLNKIFQGLYDREGLEWVWIMGDDHRFDQDIVLRLLDREVDVVIPMCVHRMPPFCSNVAATKDGQRTLKTVLDFPTTGLYRLKDGEACGDAGMLIRKRVLDAIPRPWYDSRRSGSFTSDDMAFTDRVREAGFDIYVDCDVRIGHITPMAITPVVFGDVWKIRVDAGDKMVGMLSVKPIEAAP